MNECMYVPVWPFFQVVGFLSVGDRSLLLEMAPSSPLKKTVRRRPDDFIFFYLHRLQDQILVVLIQGLGLDMYVCGNTVILLGKATCDWKGARTLGRVSITTVRYIWWLNVCVHACMCGDCSSGSLRWWKGVAVVMVVAVRSCSNASWIEEKILFYWQVASGSNDRKLLWY